MQGRRVPAGIAVAAAGILLLSLGLVASDFYPRGNPHAHFQNAQQCPKCHLLIRGKVDPERFSPDADQVCRACHKADSLGRSHPVGVRPREKYWKMKVPPEYRLDDNGRILCLTCHTAHGPFLSKIRAYPKQKPYSVGPSGGPYYKTLYLRRSDPAEGWSNLCNGCHENL